MAVIGPTLLVGADPSGISSDTLQPPSNDYFLGTDDLGRSVLMQIVYGARISLTIGVAAAAAATLVGVLIGSVAGFVGGKVDLLFMRVAEIFQVMPTLILAAVIVVLAGPGEVRIVGVIALLSWPQAARLIRGEVLRIKHLDFVEAARCLGIAKSAILTYEIVPNALAPVIALSTLTVGQAILLEASLSYFGLSGPDVISWGHSLNSGQRFLFQAWWMSVFPGLAIFLTVLAFNVLGDCLRDALNPRRAHA